MTIGTSIFGTATLAFIAVMIITGNAYVVVIPIILIFVLWLCGHL